MKTLTSLVAVAPDFAFQVLFDLQMHYIYIRKTRPPPAGQYGSAVGSAVGFGYTPRATLPPPTFPFFLLLARVAPVSRAGMIPPRGVVPVSRVAVVMPRPISASAVVCDAVPHSGNGCRACGLIAVVVFYLY